MKTTWNRRKNRMEKMKKLKKIHTPCLHGICVTNGRLEKTVQGISQVWKVVNNRNNRITTNPHKTGE